MYYFGLKNCTFFGDWVFVCGAIGVMVEDVAVVLFKILVCVPCVFVLYLNKLSIRSFGTAVISACYVADGRLDAYQCDGLYPWDVAAAGLIVTEAGGHICDTSDSGKAFDLMDPNFLVAASKALADEFLIHEKKADEERINAKNIKAIFA
ncbi:unnamed protein product [Acanthoscelides obtectus]|uniref:Inositol-phosphate phosphatase n=1 Tax=Acanthoscelides obtectus TaxID=200917 RepID=A0A9P0K4G5_ACAOB|nr:unnamed protein product [Acanthoscelides obtectus]CAK1653232.1 Inositol monophosphatase 1 [Acanthoscelides obtectus]